MLFALFATPSLSPPPREAPLDAASLRAAAPESAARKRAIICVSVPPFDTQACISPCETSWDDWCEQTNNKGEACGAGSDGDEPCLSKTCKCGEEGELGKSAAQACDTYVVRNNIPRSPTMTWLTDEWCASYCSTDDGCPDDVNDYCACDGDGAQSQQQQQAPEADPAAAAAAASAAATNDAEQKKIEEMEAKAAEDDMKAREAAQKVKETEDAYRESAGIPTIANDIQAAADADNLVCAQGYVASTESATDEWCTVTCAERGCSKDAKPVCRCNEAFAGATEPVREGDMQEVGTGQGDFEEVTVCLSITDEETDEWCNHACRVRGSLSAGCPNDAKDKCKCGDEAKTDEAQAQAAAAAKARSVRRKEALKGVRSNGDDGDWRGDEPCPGHPNIKQRSKHCAAAMLQDRENGGEPTANAAGRA